MSAVRNTRTQRRCPECAGAGSLDVRHPSGNPELEADAPCTHAGCVDGWIRWAPVDPIEQLAAARRDFRRCFPSGMRAGLRYGDIRQRVVSPLDRALPDAPKPTLEVLYANLEHALKAAA